MSFNHLPAVEAQHLSKRYVLYDKPIDRLRQALSRGRRQWGREFVALNEVSFSLPRGKVLGLVGKNGAGKSTLLQIICGTIRPTSGTIRVNGRIAALLELGAGFNPEFTGRENIYMNAAILGLSQAEIDARFQHIHDFSELGDFIEQPVKTYSSGMYVRLAFSIATSVDPDILVIDEALSVGDGGFARKSFDRIMELKAGGATILFCSHSMYHIEAICDQALWLEQGRLVDIGLPEKVARRYSESLVLSTVKPGGQGIGTPEPAPAPPPPVAQARLSRVTVSIDGHADKTLTARAGQSLLEITVEFEHATEVPIPSVAASFETQGGQLVTSTSTAFDHYTPVTDGAGKGKVCLRYPDLPLLRGHYRLNVFLVCERMLHLYDHATACAEIEVTDNGLEQGLMFMPHAWDDGPLIATRQRTG